MNKSSTEVVSTCLDLFDGELQKTSIKEGSAESTGSDSDELFWRGWWPAAGLVGRGPHDALRTKYRKNQRHCP